MEKGSTLTNHRGYAVWVPSRRWMENQEFFGETGLFDMKGGAITNCEACIGLAMEYTDILGYRTRALRFYSGTLTGNGQDNLIGMSGWFPWTYFAVSE